MICRLVNVTKSYPLGDLVVEALRNVSVGVGEGEFPVFAGPSGSGKSTALNLLGCLDRPTAGAVELDGKNVATLSDDALGALRGRHAVERRAHDPRAVQHVRRQAREAPERSHSAL